MRKKNQLVIKFNTRAEKKELESFKRLVKQNGGTMDAAGKAIVSRANRERVIW